MSDNIVPEFNKLLVNLEAASSAAPDERDFIVLLLTGSFAPIHNDHVRVMEEARRALRAQGYTVVTG
jgi:hypothetical protein